MTREHIPVEWKYDVNPETNPYFMERLGVNAVFNSGAIELNGKYYLIARVEGNDRKSFFGIAESDSPVDGFLLPSYPLSHNTTPYSLQIHEAAYSLFSLP